MTYQSRTGTGAADAAKILSGVKERINRLEEEQRGQTDTVQVFRKVTETVTITDSQTVTTQTASGFIFGQSQFGYDEFGDS